MPAPTVKGSIGMTTTDYAVQQEIGRLLSQRAPEATICPSEVARALSPEGWRPLMPQVRAVALDMARRGELAIRQGGDAIDPESPLRGPIRLGRA
nr:DUF3253 domain-containing protein [Verticiella sp. GG226]